MVSIVVLLIFSGLAVLLLARMLRTEGVTRDRLARFAQRELLVITERNGERVLTYLAVTRRWRRAGLTAAVAVAAYWQWWIDRQVEFNGLAVFAGWFAGVVIAEWRLDALSRGPARRAAALRRRKLADYVDQRLLAFPAVAWAVVAVVIAVGTVRGARGSAQQNGRLALLAVLAVLIGAALVLVTRRVVIRPQPAVEDDLVVADDALRSRSLRVLIGSAVAIAGYLGAALYDTMTDRADAGEGASQAFVGLVGLVGFAVLPILGVLIAYAPRRGSDRLARVPE